MSRARRVLRLQVDGHVYALVPLESAGGQMRRTWGSSCIFGSGRWESTRLGKTGRIRHREYFAIYFLLGAACRLRRNSGGDDDDDVC